ncbi:AAA family ATPase [Hymenobacter chitinivorans]|uniref:MoxR-like ATPase n=1 Tax=Hymenobacter chitinivorans DSM 11115 TaxID=1121954 RepID=A0A2M9B972_9BACT|nr:MoxR family ATPase [Hymenobacter chitinivorans]PJJ54493.1 MoxR-like ATPase [Hymenobacter chitinivorans DSM 11115]
MSLPSSDLVPPMQAADYQQKIKQVFAEVGKVVVGQQYMVGRLLIGLCTGGHILLEGVPGLAKTLTISTLSKVLHLHFQRVQFTPDLLPSDLVGTMIYNQNQSVFEVKKGPIFANLVLADEVNRSPAKVQSALLEAMQEKQVTIGETTYPLDLPFLVLATQNPVEQEGTYPLPEAQVDRFMMKVHVDYLKKTDELEVMRRMANMSYVGEVNPILTKEDIFGIRSMINQVQISETLEKYIIELVFATRKPAEYDLAEFAQYVQFGVSPRASIALHRAAKAVAFFDDRDYVLPEDIKDVAGDVLNHRILLNYEAEADGIRTQDLIEAILRKVPIS